MIAVTAASTPKILKVSMDSLSSQINWLKMAQLSSSCMLMKFHRQLDGSEILDLLFEYALIN